VLKSGKPFDPDYDKQFCFDSWQSRRYLQVFLYPCQFSTTM